MNTSASVKYTILRLCPFSALSVGIAQNRAQPGVYRLAGVFELDGQPEHPTGPVEAMHEGWPRYATLYLPARDGCCDLTDISPIYLNFDVHIFEDGFLKRMFDIDGCFWLGLLCFW
eukprot:COSAG05_NODE_180_length_14817_cov_423.925262_11_plen_116_part_00